MMPLKPTYEELFQRVKALEEEKSNWLKKIEVEASALEDADIESLKKQEDSIEEKGSLESIIDIEEIQSIMNDFHKLTGMVTAILDMNGTVIEATGWQDICTKFHRVHPETAQNCTESDLYLVKNIKPGEYIGYKCQNGLWDVVTPLYIGNKHLGNIYTGQFFYDDDSADEEMFIQQAEKYGFDKEAYIDAFRRIPRYSRKTISHLMSFLVKFTSYISNVSYANIELEKENHERKRAENALRESEDRLRSLINALPDLVWLKDENGVYLACNKMFERFFGAKEKDIVGKSDYDFLDKDLGDFFREHDRRAIDAGKPTSNEEWITFADDGHRALLDTIKTPMFDAEGNLVGVLGIGRDITERQQASEERDKLQGQLQQAQKLESLGRLAGGVAHDFNNMLSVIIGHAELCIEQLDQNSPLFAALKEIRKAAGRSADITRQLLAFARKQTITTRVLDLNETVAGMLQMLKRLIGEDIDITWLPGSGVWPVKMDASQIDQILANLCVNARDAITGQGRIIIETNNATFDEAYCAQHPEEAIGDFVMLSVSDDGHGMDKETLEKIFDPFFTTKGISEGTGLGLATIYGIAKQNNAFINIYSEPGCGTTFKIYLPRHLAETAEPQIKSQATQKLAQGNETILLVEDDPAILNMAKSSLKRLGYQVLAASTPGEAFQLAKKHADKIHLLMTDVIMPEMNGQELAREVASIFPRLRLLFMSGYPADVIAPHGVLDEGINFIQKPFSLQTLAVSVRKALDN
ncbi:two component system sensor histidine kinase, hybrid [Desulfosarcina variabilis str. Montpellier]|uniref:PocR ligand-binding domain-containing protein n=1 Tax=Desulfosarcina variabilis TaxID=2300 RepID=UPI003AFB1A9A